MIAAALARLRGTMARNITRTFATRVTVMGLGMVVSVVAARTLGPAGRGTYAAAAAFAALLAQFGNLGLHGANTYLVAADRTRLRPLLGNTVAVGLGWGSLLGLGGLVFTGLGDHAIVAPSLRLLTAGMVPLLLSYMLLQNLAMGVERFDLFNQGELLNVLTTLGLLPVLLTLAALTPATMLGISCAGPLLAATWLLARLVRLQGMTRSRDLLLRGLQYGWRPYLLSLAGFAVSRSDLFVVTSRLGPTDAGHYSVALTLVGIFGTFPAIVGQVLFPRLGATPDLETRWRETGRTALWLTLLVALAAVAAALVAGLLVRLLFGETFLPAVPVFRGLLVGAVFMALHVALVQYLNSLGYPVSVVILWLMTAALNLALNLVLVPRLGLLGGAWASGITYAILAGGIAVLALRYSPATARGRARFEQERR